MEDAGKQSLAGLLRKFKTIGGPIIKFYLKQMLEGLNYCHQKNICHRDLKLENVLMDESNNIK
jgi:WNK lysine deficient protein kinase